MENEIELLNKTEADLLMLMKQYKSGQYSHLADCIVRVRTVRETLRELEATQQSFAPDVAICEDCGKSPAMEGCSVCAECGL